MHSHLALNRVRTAFFENSFVAAVMNVITAMHHRWLSFCFARRFYHEARKVQSSRLDVPHSVPGEDFTEMVIRRSLPASIHALVQLRVASQLASIEETTLRSRFCHEAGWSGEQIGAALLGSFNTSLAEREKLVLRYADDMTRTPIDVDPQVVKQLRCYFSHPDLLELTASIAHENFRVRLSNASRKLG